MITKKSALTATIWALVFAAGGLLFWPAYFILVVSFRLLIGAISIGDLIGGIRDILEGIDRSGLQTFWDQAGFLILFTAPFALYGLIAWPIIAFSKHVGQRVKSVVVGYAIFCIFLVLLMAAGLSGM